MSPLAHVVQVAILIGIVLGLAVVGIGTAVADHRRAVARARAAHPAGSAVR